MKIENVYINSLMHIMEDIQQESTADEKNNGENCNGCGEPYGNLCRVCGRYPSSYVGYDWLSTRQENSEPERGNVLCESVALSLAFMGILVDLNNCTQ